MRYLLFIHVIKMEPSPAKRPRPSQRFCPHCNEILSYKTYRAHKRLYFDSDNDIWFREPQEDTEYDSKSDDEPDCGRDHSSSPSFDSLPMETADGDFLGSPPHSDPALSESETEYVSEPGETTCNRLPVFKYAT